MSRLKRLALGALVRSPIRSLFAPFLAGVAPIFMLHRFADPEQGNPGHDPAALRRHLEWLRRHRYRLVPVAALVNEMAVNPRAADRAVCMTVDDGYEDFGRIGWPVFAEFDCPVTVFLTSDFTDGKMWFWWDRIEFALAHSSRDEWTIHLSDSTHTIAWRDPASRSDDLSALVDKLKLVSEPDRLSALDQIAAQSEVATPAAAPAKYAPLNWSDVRRLASKGVTFGAHSVTHPILSRTSSEQSEWEMRESWDRLRRETSAAVPVFCYPNGRREDYGAREIETAQRAGLSAALATHPGYASAQHFATGNTSGPFALPRFPWPEAHEQLVQIVSGIERAKSLLRRDAQS